MNIGRAKTLRNEAKIAFKTIREEYIKSKLEEYKDDPKKPVDMARLAMGAYIKSSLYGSNLYVIIIFTNTKPCFQGFRWCNYICDML